MSNNRLSRGCSRTTRARASSGLASYLPPALTIAPPADGRTGALMRHWATSPALPARHVWLSVQWRGSVCSPAFILRTP